MSRQLTISAILVLILLITGIVLLFQVGEPEQAALPSDGVNQSQPDQMERVAADNFGDPAPIPVDEEFGELTTETAEALAMGAVSFFDPGSVSVLTDGEWAFDRLDADNEPARIEVSLSEVGSEAVPLAAGQWRVSSRDGKWNVTPSEFSLLPSEHRLLLAAPSGGFEVLVTDQVGVALEGITVVLTPEYGRRWSAFRHVWQIAMGVDGEVQTTDGSGRARFSIATPGSSLLAAVDPAIGVVTTRVVPRPNEQFTLALPGLDAGESALVVDALNQEPIPGAVLNDTAKLLSSRSGSDGRLRVWPKESGDYTWTLSAPGYVPRLVKSHEMVDGIPLTLHPLARLHWTLDDAGSSASVPGDAEIVNLSLADPPIASRHLLPCWNQLGSPTGSFVVPHGVAVRLDATAGIEVATTELTIDETDEYVTLRYASAPSGLVVRVASGKPPPDDIQLTYDDRTFARIPFANKVAAVPKSHLVSTINVRQGNGIIELYQSKNPTADPSVGEIVLDLPSMALQQFQISDLKGNPAPGMLLKLSSRFAVDEQVRSSHPAWQPRFFRAEAESGSRPDGLCSLRLAPGTYAYTVHRFAPHQEGIRGVELPIIASGKVEVTNATEKHEIIIDRERWVELQVRWTDGSTVDLFEIRYDTHTATLRERGLHGHWSGWMPSSDIPIAVTAEGARSAQEVLGASVNKLVIALYPKAGAGRLEVVGIDKSISAVVVELFEERNGGYTYLESIEVHRNPPGYFDAPESSLLAGKIARVTAEGIDGSRFVSPMMQADALVSVVIELSPERE